MPVYEYLLERLPHRIDINADPDMEMCMVDVFVSSGSKVENKRISDIKTLKNGLIVNIDRNGKNILPKGHTKLLSGDIVKVAIPEEFLHTQFKKFAQSCGVD